MLHKLARRMGKVPTSGLGAVWARAAQLEAAGRDIVHFEIGRPDLDTPQPIKDAARRALDMGQVHYTLPRGIPELREAVAADLAARVGVRLDPDTQVMITIGAVEAITLIMLTILDPGDEVLVPEPMYPFYRGWAEFAGGVTVGAPLNPDDGFAITEAQLEHHLTPRTKLMIINSPNNPTGAGLDRASLEAVARVAQRHDLLVISDEVYDLLTYDGFRHQSLAALPGMAERTLIVNSFSKGYAMDGWRIGYMAGPAELLTELDKLHLRASTCANAPAQWGALQALRMGEEAWGPLVQRFAARRGLALDLVANAPGFACHAPQGAFYLWLDYGPVNIPDEQVVDYLLDEAGVAICPGLEFGPQGRGRCRISYATSRALIERGLTRLFQAVDRIRP